MREGAPATRRVGADLHRNGDQGAPEAMLRFALCREGAVAPDIRRRLPGRGVWTRLSFETVSRAARRQAFSRAFRAKAEAPIRSPRRSTRCSRATRCSRCRWRTRPAWSSPARSRSTRRSKRAASRRSIQASDGAADGAAKRSRAPERANSAPEAEAVARINMFSSRQLDLALGRANVIHAALNMARRVRPFSQGRIVCAAIARARRTRRPGQSAAARRPTTPATLGGPDQIG